MRTTLIGLMVLAVIGGGVLIVRSRSTGSTSALSATSPSIPLDVPIETATLDPQDDSDSQGIATRQFVDRIFVHGLSAVLPAPPAGQFYAGWLVSASPPTQLFTGKLVAQADSFTLDYSAPVDYRGYDEVLVTLQTSQTATPETVILRGSFPVE